MKKTQSDKHLNNSDPQNSRRLFLQKGVIASGGVVATATIPKSVLASPEPVTEPQAKEEGYHVTDHITNYYKGARC